MRLFFLFACALYADDLWLRNGKVWTADPGRLWFSQTPKLLINWGLPFFLRFPCSPPLVALAAAFLAFFRQQAALQLETLALRHQLGVLQRSVKRPKLTAADRFLWAWLATVVLGKLILRPDRAGTRRALEGS